ncbi:putative endonuclease [Novosphingobium chloroacetimidivorans]|uniref:Putative endonuclease n=1 Tax=Novosphingobium chloroacetimidivorans TaxID=1428314 RepID=A0A7W7K850_9SPHN|nr:GIY-YIG nuclease family protein [Novosphingobium chloroacetimidivorans]MBB4857454.1 putative endonuclease [Novosphingobium chloroacetimidivorans]
MQRGGWVYMMSDRYRGGIYTGVTANLQARIYQHREGRGSQFVRENGFTRLVFAEPHDEIEPAILREKRIKKWRREWKIRLIETMNPDWDDLWDQLGGVLR